MKKKPLSADEQLLFHCMRMKLSQDLLEAGWSPDDKAAFALVNNEALQQLQRVVASPKGVKARRAKLEKKRAGFSDKVKACLDRGEDTSDSVKRWAGEHRVTDDTIRNWLKEVAPK